MRFALTHPMMSHPHDPGLSTGEGVAAIAEAAETAGFDGFGFTDHPAPGQRWLESGGHDALDPFAALGFVAARTSTIRLIPNLVVLPYRNPFVVAKAGATLDCLSGGRFTLAVGAGHQKAEFAALGVDIEERAALMDEALRAIHAIWTGDDITLEGRHFDARRITAHPRPATQPRPPIWVGGNTGAARQRVVVHGEGWCPFPAPPALAERTGSAPMDTDDLLRAGIDDLRRRLDSAGRDPDGVDVAFSAYNRPPTTAEEAEPVLERIDQLAALGVTWTYLSVPLGPVDAVVDALGHYAELVLTER